MPEHHDPEPRPSRDPWRSPAAGDDPEARPSPDPRPSDAAAAGPGWTNAGAEGAGGATGAAAETSGFGADWDRPARTGLGPPAPPDPEAEGFARSEAEPARPSTRRVVGVSAITSALVAALVALLIVPLVSDGGDGGQSASPDDVESPGGGLASVDLDDLEDLDISSPVEAITEAVLPAVARVDVPGGAGSAVVYREDGYLLTNHHVVRDAPEIRVVLADGRRLPAEVVGSADFADLALLRVDADNLPTVDFAEEIPAVGSLAVAIGSPFGFDATVTQGVVSAVNRSIEAEGEPLGDLVQTDAAINPGNSGGPLVNATGEVIGINTAIYSQVGANAGIGFAIPSTNVVAVAERLRTEGEIAPAFLGIRGTSLDPQDADTFDVEVAQGALVVEVVPETPADEAGLRENDVIVTVDGRRIDSMVALAARIRLFEPGSTVELGFVRDGETMNTEIELVETPDDL